MQKLVRLKAGRTAVGTGDFEDPDPFPEEALGTDINDQGRRHMAPAAIQADRGATSGMQASGDTHNLLFWLQQVTTCAEQLSHSVVTACCHLKWESNHHLAAVCMR